MRGDWKRDRNDKREFYKFLDSIARRKGYRIYHEAEALLEIYFQADQWLKSPKGWVPQEGQGADKLLSDLLHHLFAQYEVPKFMDDAWRKQNKLHIAWFIHLGTGQNIRTAPQLQTHLTKKMAHYFLQAPDHYTINEALVYGQVIALGGNDLLLKQLFNTQLVHLCKNQEFWLSLVQFLLNNQELIQDNKVGQILDFFNAKKLLKATVDDYGQLVGEVSNKLSVKGKTADSLMKAVDKWQRDMTNSYGGSYNKLVTWTPVKVNNFLVNDDGTSYRIMQLTNNYALLREAEKMKHCIASYIEKCQTGRASVWALTATTGRIVSPLLTIQLDDDNAIVQVRGKTNRLPEVTETQIVRRWATRENLDIAGYCELNQ